MAPTSQYGSQLSIPLPPEETVSGLIGEDFDPAKILNVIKMFAGTGDMFPATIGFVKALFQTADIDPKTREIIALRCAQVLNSRYEWLANASLAKNTGLLPEEINAAASSGPVVGIDSIYVLLCKATDELSNTSTLTDETLSEMLGQFDETTCRKYVLMISWFNLLSRFLNGCRVPLETSDKIGGNTLPL